MYRRCVLIRCLTVLSVWDVIVWRDGSLSWYLGIELRGAD